MNKSEFISWFRSLSDSEKTQVWYECEAMNAEEFKTLLKLGSDARIALSQIETICKTIRQ